MDEDNEDVWFQCQRCTNCCKWEGDVVLADGEVEEIAEFLKIPLYEFVRNYTRLRDSRQGLSLIDKEGTTECIMLDGIDCRLQDVKPYQCTGFPNRWNFKNWPRKKTKGNSKNCFVWKRQATKRKLYG